VTIFICWQQRQKRSRRLEVNTERDLKEMFFLGLIYGTARIYNSVSQPQGRGPVPGPRLIEKRIYRAAV
jgi:hypothetical protein